MKKITLLFAALLLCFGFIFACGRVVREEAEETPTLTVAPFDETKISTETVSIEGETVSREVVSDQIIVTLATGESLSNLEALAAQHGCSVVGQNSLLNTYQIQIPSNKTPAEMRSVFSSSNVVQDASSNLIIYTSALPNDPAFEHASDYWGFSKISAEAVWDLKDDIDDSNMIVAVIDTGIDSDHEEFAARIQEGENYVVGGTSTEDDLGHGTSVAGIIGAKGNNAKGIAGMSWNCKLVAIRAFKKKQVSAGSYAGVSTTYAIINALGYAAYVAKAKVINCSFGVETTDSTVINKFKEAVRSCKDKDALIVVAAGNENKSASNQYPGALSDDADVGGAIINVGGTGGNNAYNDARWNSSDGASNYGDKVDVAAPACRLYSTYISSEANPDYYKRLQWGTSLAAPFVAGTAALIRSLNPSLTAAGVKSIITETADSISADQSIGGRLNAWKALLKAMSEGNVSKAVIGIASNVSGAKIYFSSNGGAGFTDTGKTTTAEGAARIMVTAGSGLNYYFKLTKSGYQDAISGLITYIAKGTEVTETIDMTAVTTTTTSTSTTTSTAATTSSTITTTTTSTTTTTVAGNMITGEVSSSLTIDNGNFWIRTDYTTSSTRNFLNQIGLSGQGGWLSRALYPSPCLTQSDPFWTGSSTDRSLIILKNTSNIAAYQSQFTVTSGSKALRVTWKFIVPHDKKYAVWVASFESIGTDKSVTVDNPSGYGVQDVYFCYPIQPTPETSTYVTWEGVSAAVPWSSVSADIDYNSSNRRYFSTYNSHGCFTFGYFGSYCSTDPFTLLYLNSEMGYKSIFTTIKAVSLSASSPTARWIGMLAFHDNVADAASLFSDAQNNLDSYLSQIE